jgi:aspartyl-tRNA(Asn)/glutamyl-tRNA(Gln) amidotransferase subunit B
MPQIASIEPVIGLEVHIELSCTTKAFSRALSPACIENFAHVRAAGPNSLLDPTVLGLPGALPVLNKKAVEQSIEVGLALGCQIAPYTKWDRKNYFYADMPKGYQISQYDLPLCFDGSVDVQYGDHESARVGIIRAHLEEDAGKLLHQAPGGHAIDHSILDLNRAGTALLEVVTQPDFRSSQQVVAFCKQLRQICRFLGVSEGIMEQGHIRFEPNVNCVLTLDDGTIVKTPIVEIKNLNSFASVAGAIEFELAEQPARWQTDKRQMGPGMKVTRGWDDVRKITFVQREKEDAHDYRYFPDPDLLAVRIEKDWIEQISTAMPRLPHLREAQYIQDFNITPRQAQALVAERADSELFEQAINLAVQAGIEYPRAGRAAANVILQSGLKRVSLAQAGDDLDSHDPMAALNVASLGVSPSGIAGLVVLREQELISAQNADLLFDRLMKLSPDQQAINLVRDLANELGMLIVRDESSVDSWVQEAIAQNPQAAADVRAGKMQAIGRLVGAAMKASSGKADAATLKARIEAVLKN